MTTEEFAKVQTDKIMKDLGFAEASDDIKAQILNKLQMMVDEELLYALVSRLDETKLKEIEDELQKHPDLSDDDKAAETMRLIEEKTDNIEEVLTSALTELYDNIRKDAAMVKLMLQSKDDQPQDDSNSQKQL